MTTVATPSALRISSLTAGYGSVTVLRDVTVDVPVGSVAALLGPNGAGKTTLLRAAAGVLRGVSGTVHVNDQDVTRRPAFDRTRAGLCLIPEGRGVFPGLTVRENLLLQTPHRPPRASFDAALDAFPALADRLDHVAGTLSGGQQQMLALSRCYLSRPTVVLLDEVSMGLAPRIVDDIFAALRGLARTGVALLLVEQYVTRALEMADLVYLLDRGQVTFSGPPTALDQDQILKGYLGGDLKPTEDTHARRA